MKKILLLTKTLLAVALLCVGQNAWADLKKTNVINCDFENSETVFTFTGRGGVANTEYPAESGNHAVNFTSASNAGNAVPGAFAYYDFSAEAKTAVKVDVSFDCYLPTTSGQVKVSIGDATYRTSSIFNTTGAWSYNGTGAIFVFGTERGKLNGKTNENYASVNGNPIGSTTALKANEVLDLWVTISATIDVTNSKISYTMKNKSTDAVLVSATDADFFNATASACTQIDIQTGVNSVSAVYIDNLCVDVYTDASEKYADYTIEYKYGETEIKSARVVESAKVGNTTTIVDSDKNPIWYGEPSEKYMYSSDDASEQTVAEDGSTVVTVNFRKATVESYTLNAINSANLSVLEEIASGSIVEGESARVYYHKAVKKDGVWYIRNQNGAEPYYGIDVVAGTNTVSYTANENVKYFFEVEGLPVVQVGSYGGWRNDGLANRSSNGVAPRHYAKNYAYTEALAGGVYTLSMNARNQSSSVSDNITIAIMDEGGTITPLEIQFEDWAKASTAEKTVSVSIPDGAKFVLKAGDNNSNLNMDFLMFTRTGDYTVSITPATAKSTYVTTKALDFTDVEGLDAYVATAAANGSVTLEKVGAVPAGTPLMLIGTATTEYKVPVVAYASAPEENMFVAGDGTTEFDGSTFDYILYSDGLFYKIGSGTVATTKAYLHCDNDPTAAGARGLRISFGGNITGVANVEAAAEAGQKEGKFFKDGKLVILKNGKKFNAAGQIVK
ncbi:MAG: hypothetical protein IJ897_06130 [Prevotella sp.]|nr:hypothetical protein [Prevotella sp.]